MAASSCNEIRSCIARKHLVGDSIVSSNFRFNAHSSSVVVCVTLVGEGGNAHGMSFWVGSMPVTLCVRIYRLDFGLFPVAISIPTYDIK